MTEKISIGRDTVPVINPELVIERTFDVPQDLLWQAWISPDQLVKWWGAKGFSMMIDVFDLRPGGMFHYCMRSQGGQEMCGRFIYLEVQEPEKLVFITSFSDKPGGVIRNPMNPTWPLEVFNDFTFSEKDGQTTLLMKGRPHNATPEEVKTFSTNHENVKKGLNGTFEQLDQFLSELRQE